MKAMKRVVIITFWMTLCVLLFFVIIAGVNKWVDDTVSAVSVSTPAPSPTTLPDLPAIMTELIFVVNDDGTLNGCYLSEIDGRSCRWRLDVIPNDSRMSLSASLYKNLSKENVAVPQIATLSELFRSFSRETASQNCFMALSELMNITPDSVIELKKDDFARAIKDNPEMYAFDGFLADDLQNEVKAAGGLAHYIESFYAGKQSSLSIRERLFYLETFESLTNLRISCRLIPGERHNNGYVVKTDKNDFFK